MESEIENIYKNTISNDKDKELLMIFLMKDFIKNHSLEKLSDQIFGDLVKNDFIKSENLKFLENNSNLDKIKNLILQNIPNKDILNTSRFLNDFNINDKVGMGGFGSVFNATNKLDKKTYAIKIINMNYQNMEYIIREAENLSLLEHPNIIRYYGSWVEDLEINEQHKYLSYEPESIDLSGSIDSDIDLSASIGSDIDLSASIESDIDLSASIESDIESSKYLFLQMELADCSLKDIQNDLDYTKKLDIFKQIVLGLDEIHSKNIIHRDLKPSNILLINNKVKIGDFGLSKYIEGKNGKKTHISGINNELTGNLGSVLYSSPEQLYGKEYDYRTDIYSLGIILFEMLNRFETEMERNIKITELKKGKVESYLEEKYIRFIKVLIEDDYKKRPDTKKILNMLETISF